MLTVNEYRKEVNSTSSWDTLWNYVCVVTRKRALLDSLQNVIDASIRVKSRLSDILYEKGCNIYLIDMKVPDMYTWPAPILTDPNAQLKEWVFLISDTSDVIHLGTIPPKSVFIELKKSDDKKWVSQIVAYLKSKEKQLEPNSRTRIQKVDYLANHRMFIIRMGTGKTYLLGVDELAEADPSNVVRWTIGKSHHYFRIRQESGNRFEVPWDDILYHCEPEYEYYKGKQAENIERDTAKRIGERVRELRMVKGLSVSALAQEARMKRPNLSRLENGRQRPSLETLERLAAALNVQVAELVARNRK